LGYHRETACAENSLKHSNHLLGMSCARVDKRKLCPKCESEKGDYQRLGRVRLSGKSLGLLNVPPVQIPMTAN